MTQTTTPTIPDTTAQGSTASTVDEARSQARDVATTARSEASKVGQEVRSQTSRLVDQVGSQTRDRANSSLSRVAGSIGEMSDELDRMAQGASRSDSSLAGFAREGSSMARRVADRLESDGLDGALDDVKRFARRQPVAFLAGAFAAGMILGRLTRNADFGSIAEAARTDDGADADPAPAVGTGAVRADADGELPSSTAAPSPGEPAP